MLESSVTFESVKFISNAKDCEDNVPGCILKHNLVNRLQNSTSIY